MIQKQKKSAVLISGFITLLFVSFVSQAYELDKLNKVCSEDLLDVAEAIERNHWAYRCGFYKREDSKVTEEMFLNYTLRSSNNPKGLYDVIRYYPVFENADRTISWKAPTDRNASCGVPAHYKMTGLCSTASPLNYAEAIERIEWAYACSHLGDVNKKSARNVKYDHIFQSYPGKLDTQPDYPIFVDTASGEYIRAPVHRDTDCNEGQYKMIGYHSVEIPNTCAVRRYQALHEGLITELEYEDLKTRHKAPQSLDNLRPVACYNKRSVYNVIQWNKDKFEKVVTGGCKKFGSNYGCKTQLNCPYGYAAVSGRAACNLEYPNRNFNLGKWGFMDIVRKSDHTGDGYCHLGNTSRRSGRAKISVDFTRSIMASCKEYDRNGGDCQIKAEILCLPESLIKVATKT